MDERTIFSANVRYIGFLLLVWAAYEVFYYLVVPGITGEPVASKYGGAQLALLVGFKAIAGFCLTKYPQWIVRALYRRSEIGNPD